MVQGNISAGGLKHLHSSNEEPDKSVPLLQVQNLQSISTQ